MSQLSFSREDFLDIEDLELQMYYRPSIPNFPTLDSFAVLPASLFFNPATEGNVLVIFQVTKSPEHKLNGAVVKRLQNRVKALGIDFARTLFMWVSSERGIIKEQKVTNDEGKPYVRDAPEMEQWLLAFKKDYDDLFKQVLEPASSV